MALADEPLVSIVIPTYNQAGLLEKALQSVLAQTYQNWEAVIVNNFSEDDTVEVVERFADPRMTLVSFANNGVIAASRNEAIARAKGVYIAFLDSDDFWERDKLFISIRSLDQGADLVCHGVTFRWEDGRSKEVSCHDDQLARYENLLFRGNRLITSATVVRKTILDQVGGFSERKEFITVEDYDLWLRIAQVTDRITFVSLQLGTYRIHSSNLSKAGLQQFNAEKLLLEDYFSKWTEGGVWTWVKMKKRYALLYYSTAMMFKDSGNKIKALSFFLGALKNNPLLLEVYRECFTLCCTGRGCNRVEKRPL